jgi:hypothetical protein
MFYFTQSFNYHPTLWYPQGKQPYPLRKEDVCYFIIIYVIPVGPSGA